jgi:hypothetical protein
MVYIFKMKNALATILHWFSEPESLPEEDCILSTRTVSQLAKSIRRGSLDDNEAFETLHDLLDELVQTHGLRKYFTLGQQMSRQLEQTLRFPTTITAQFKQATTLFTPDDFAHIHDNAENDADVQSFLKKRFNLLYNPRRNG